MENPIDGTDGKLGRGFMSADKLEEIDIGDGDKSRPTFISANLDPVFREELIKLLREYKDCFAWDYSEMPGLDRSIVEHRLPIKSGFKPYKQPPWKIYKDEVLADVKKEIEDYWRQISFGHVDMLIGSLILLLSTRRTGR
jgi:hypothetical protein